MLKLGSSKTFVLQGSIFRLHHKAFTLILPSLILRIMESAEENNNELLVLTRKSHRRMYTKNCGGWYI